MEHHQEHHEPEKINETVSVVSVTQESSKKDRFLAISILIAAVIVAGAVVFSAVYKGNSGAAPLAGGIGGNGAGTLGQNGQQQQANPALLALNSRDAILGNANAPVTVVEYGDYQCPFCAQYFSSLQPQIVQNYVNSGKVKLVFRDFPFLGPESTAAAQAAQCAEDQNKLWAYHDALYTTKLGDDGKGGTENDGSLNRTLFMKLAGQLNLDTTAFASCIDGNKDANIVAQEKNTAAQAGVNSTPTTFVNGVLVADANGNSVGANSTAILNAISAAVNASK